MSVRAKFYVTRIEKTKWQQNDEMNTIVLAPVYSADENSENKKFWRYTPSGEVKLGTINKAASDYFELGKEYYIDFTAAEAA